MFIKVKVFNQSSLFIICFFAMLTFFSDYHISYGGSYFQKGNLFGGKGKKSVSNTDEKVVRQYVKYAFDTININHYVTDADISKKLLTELKDYYRFSDFQLIWATMDGPNKDFELVINEISQADKEGLDSEDYKVQEIGNYVDEVYDFSQEIKLAKVVDLDFRVTAAYLTYAWHLYNGKTSQALLTSWFRKPKKIHLAQYLAQKDIDKALKTLTPTTNDYAMLKKYLVKYKEVEESGEWKYLPEDTDLQAGDTDEHVPDLRLRLSYTGDISLKINDVYSEYFDPRLEQAVIQFQKRHGLKTDGIVSERTVRELNTPIERRVAQIKLNMERIRKMPRDLGENYVFVNIPEYKLYAYNNDSKRLETDVIVGTAANSTPVTGYKLEYTIFNPNAGEDLIDPKYEDTKFMEGFEDFKRKVDGDTLQNLESRKKGSYDFGNKTLGLLEINKPNAYYVCPNSPYVNRLFQNTNRAFSQGSVLIENPEKLASFLLKGQRRWNTTAELEESMATKRPLTTTLSSRVQLFTIYRTVWVDDEGVLNFRKDIYNFDRAQLRLLNKRRARKNY